MKKIINKMEMRKEWVLENWWEKALYIWGSINFWLTAFWIFCAILIGILDTLAG